MSCIAANPRGKSCPKRKRRFLNVPAGYCAKDAIQDKWMRNIAVSERRSKDFFISLREQRMSCTFAENFFEMLAYVVRGAESCPEEGNACSRFPFFVMKYVAVEFFQS